MADAAAGTSKRAAEILAQLQEPQGHGYVLPYDLAKAYAARDHRGKALEWLQIAYREGNPDLTRVELRAPLCDGLRDDPRFTGLMRRVGWRA